ncbi:MAG TPA: excalibur calcium-binding domain-containing protein [Nakamurella multipartita]|nr:excalibur calcium-binding domain-containing protein [Nakamurella multipartita]
MAVIFTVPAIATHGAKPTGETSPLAAPTTQATFADSSTPVARVPVEQPVSAVAPAVQAPVVTPAPAEQPAPVEAPVPTTPASVVVSYENCRAVWDAIGRPINAGEPGFEDKLDTNHNGVGCEQDPR